MDKFQFLQKFLNSRGKELRNEKKSEKDKPKDPKNPKKDEDLLTKKAIEELQRDMCINKVKRKTFGSVTVPKAKTNKRFLASTLSQCISHNKRQSNKHQEKSTDKLKELDRKERLRKSKQKFGERKHEFEKPEKKKKRRRRSRSSSSE